MDFKAQIYMSTIMSIALHSKGLKLISLKADEWRVQWELITPKDFLLSESL